MNQSEYPVDRLSRPYTATGGRTREPDSQLRLDTQVTATSGTGARPLTTQQALLLELCPTPVAVVELAAGLSLPLGMALAMVADLRDTGRVNTQPPFDMASNGVTSIDTLRRLRDALKADVRREHRSAQ